MEVEEVNGGGGEIQQTNKGDNCDTYNNKRQNKFKIFNLFKFLKRRGCQEFEIQVQ